VLLLQEQYVTQTETSRWFTEMTPLQTTVWSHMASDAP